MDGRPSRRNKTAFANSFGVAGVGWGCGGRSLKRLRGQTELKRADRTVGVNCNIFSNISLGTA